jgi:hypothetical protein
MLTYIKYTEINFMFPLYIMATRKI